MRPLAKWIASPKWRVKGIWAMLARVGLKYAPDSGIVQKKQEHARGEYRGVRLRHSCRSGFDYNIFWV